MAGAGRQELMNLESQSDNLVETSGKTTSDFRKGHRREWLCDTQDSVYVVVLMGVIGV